MKIPLIILLAMFTCQSILLSQEIEQAATGNFPDIAADKSGNIHIVYNRNGLKYKAFIDTTQAWENETDLGCDCGWVARQDPDIVIDSEGNPHVICGNHYAKKINGKWIFIAPHTSINRVRDSELAIDSNDYIYLVHRQGFDGGHIALQRIHASGSAWEKLTDPDVQDDYGSISNHVYTDLAISPADNSIHIVQRHGPDLPYEIAYRRADNTDLVWLRENVDEDRKESPHIIVDHSNHVFISTGSGNVFRRTGDNNWTHEGRVLHAEERTQPEFSCDSLNNIYLACFGGKYNIRKGGKWGIAAKIPNVNPGLSLGFVEGFGGKDFTYITWEEGTGIADEGLSQDARIYVALLKSDGSLESIKEARDTTTLPQDTTSVNDSKTSDLKIFPNPANQFVSITHPKAGIPERLEILNIRGSVIYTSTVTQDNPGEITIPVESFDHGLYMVILNYKHGERKFARFIK